MSEIDYRTWKARYRPQRSPAGRGERGVYAFLHYSRHTLPPNVKVGNIWTLHHSGKTGFFLRNGVRHVDVLGHVVCEKMWDEGDDIAVTFT